MKVFVALCATLACASAGLVAPATTLLRAPSHDSAVIQSHRFGGNFAYRTDEAHAYAAIQPVVSTVRKAVGVSYSHGAPIVKSTTVQHAAPVAYAAAPAIATYAAAPAVHTYAAAPAVHTYAAAPAITTYAAAPAAAYAAAPAYGYPGLAYNYGAYGLGLPLSIEKVEEAEAEAEAAVVAAE